MRGCYDSSDKSSVLIARGTFHFVGVANKKGSQCRDVRPLFCGTQSISMPLPLAIASIEASMWLRGERYESALPNSRKVLVGVATSAEEWESVV